MTEQPMEFYGSVQIMPESDPATDPLLTVRMQPPNTWERRYDGDAVRAVKVSTMWPQWFVLGSSGVRIPDDQVKDWPVQHPLVWGVAYDRLAGKAVPPPASASAVELVGDMGVDAFKGETS